MHLVLHYCSGGTLLRHLQSRGHGVGLDEETSTSIVTQVGDALAHMHELGVTHRDVKPGNVVYDNTERETVRLVDFGFSQLHKAFMRIDKDKSGHLSMQELTQVCEEFKLPIPLTHVNEVFFQVRSSHTERTLWPWP